jgi:glycosyltransferase involved in cell wall biosynthesis
VLFHGSIVPARLPLTVIHALARLPSHVRLLIAGYETIGHPGYLRTLALAAEELEIGSRVEFSGTLSSHSALMRHCATCHVGLALMPRTTDDFNERTMLGASNKPFDYLACGLAVLVTDLPDWRATYVDPGYGLACDPDSPESVAAALDWFLAHPAERIAMGERGRRRILEDWNYDSRFEVVRAQLDARPA